MDKPDTTSVNKMTLLKKYDHVIEYGENVFYVGNDNAFTKETIWGIISNGTLIVKPIYDSIGPISEGMIAVKLDNLWGYVNTKGVLVIKPQYATAGVFINGIAKVWNSYGESSYIDKKGNECEL